MPETTASSTAACSARCGRADLRGIKTFHRDYPEATPLLLYRG